MLGSVEKPITFVEYTLEREAFFPHVVGRIFCTETNVEEEKLKQKKSRRISISHNTCNKYPFSMIWHSLRAESDLAGLQKLLQAPRTSEI